MNPLSRVETFECFLSSSDALTAWLLATFPALCNGRYWRRTAQSALERTMNFMFVRIVRLSVGKTISWWNDSLEGKVDTVDV
jgi:hypothetical protein